MSNILIILGCEVSEFAKGQFNTSLFEKAKELLSSKHNIKTTVIKDGYNELDEAEKFKWADTILFQYPIYWFSTPSSMKRYIDRVYSYGVFFGFGKEGEYGFSSGLMKGKKYMLSTTWNSPKYTFDNNDSFLEGKSVDDMLIAMHKTNQYCGFEPMENFAVFDVVKNPNYDEHKKEFIKHLTKHFNL